MNVKDMIAWLQTQPQDAIVEVFEIDRAGNIPFVSLAPFDPQKNVTFYDWSGNKYLLPNHRRFNKKVLTLGLEYES